MPILKQITKNKALNNWLLKHRRNVTSQSGEDGIIEKIFQIIPNQNNWCVEFGAWEGKAFSNTWNMINNSGWRGVLIEADEARYRQLARRYKNKTDVICINRVVEFEGSNSLESILSDTDIPVDFDLLSIDIDGNDYYVWESMEKYVPKVIVIEFNPTIPNDIVFVQDKNHRTNQGCSLLGLIQLGEKKGYEIVAVTDINAFFVKRKYFPLFHIEDNSIDMMYDQVPHETKIFQLYDGTLMLAGQRKMYWHGGIEISNEDIQVLPQALRVFHGRLK